MTSAGSVGEASGRTDPALGMIWAQSADGYIGRDGAIPWHLPEDQARFRALTQGAVVIMGHGTWRSLPDRFRPLPGRVNVVLSRDGGLRVEGAQVVPDVAAALAVADDRATWVIGGAQVYAAFLPHTGRLEVTDIDVVAAGDTPAPAVGPGWRTQQQDPSEGWSTSRTGLRYRFRTLVPMAV